MLFHDLAHQGVKFFLGLGLFLDLLRQVKGCPVSASGQLEVCVDFNHFTRTNAMNVRENSLFNGDAASVEVLGQGAGIDLRRVWHQR